MTALKTARWYVLNAEKPRKIMPWTTEINTGPKGWQKGLTCRHGIIRSLYHEGGAMEFDPNIKTQISKALDEIILNGGFGELIIVIRKGNPEYVNHTIIKRFNQPRREEIENGKP